MESEAVIQSIDVSTIYEVPILMQKENLDQIVLKKLGLINTTQLDLKNGANFLMD